MTQSKLMVEINASHLPAELLYFLFLITSRQTHDYYVDMETF